MNTTTPQAARLEADTRALVRMLAEGGTLAGLYGLGRDELGALYAYGHLHYGQARYGEALKAFARLVTLRHGEPRYLNALAATQQKLGRHAQAVHYYGLSQLLDASDPAPTYHTAVSLVALGHTADAADALRIVLRQCAGRPARQALAARAQALLGLLPAPAATA
jgi:type III secretion system low calcium response chaperone LcrH/SycD